MKKQLYILGILWAAVSCTGDDPALKMVVEGNVKGLKKGTLYLQTIPDSVLVSVDSLEIRGDGNFKFETQVSEPDIYYLYLDNSDNNPLNDRITFFGEPGQYRIDTRWDNFQAAAIIDGTETHEKYEVYRENMSRFNLQQMEISRAMGSVSSPGDTISIDSLENALDESLRRSYLYALNFALSNKESHLAPYIAWSEVSDANPKYLDSVYRTLPSEIAESKYGKRLKQLLDNTP